MPQQAPSFRPPGWRERKPWQPQEGRVDQRKRGRAGMRDRAQVLAEEPLCRLCLAKGKQVASDVVDHVVPLAWGGQDDRGNKQGLCDPCHDAKSKAERAEDRAGRG
jgi:5-methylcytosine-specific restriction enzyme A